MLKLRNVNPVRKIDNEYNIVITKYELEQEKKILEDFLKKNSFTFDSKQTDDDSIIDKTSSHKISITQETIQLTYDNFSYSEIIRKILPQDFDQIPNSYEIIGKIAHLNLREKFLGYKYLIGQIILDVCIEI